MISSTTDHESLESLITEALQHEEIIQGMVMVGFSPEFLRHMLMQKLTQILESVERETAELRHSQRELETAEQTLRQVALRPPTWLNILRESLGWILALLFLLLTTVILLWNFIGRTVVLDWLSSLSGYLVIALLIGLALGLVLIQYRRRKQAYQQEINRHYNEQKLQLGIDSLREKIQLREKAKREALLEKGILPQLRATINTHLNPSYANELVLVNSPGLAEVFDPVYEVPTEHKEKLLRLLESMPGGSIGVAGSRGAGKTTLLTSLCRTSTRQFKGRPVLSVLVSAPVQYDGRDFVLHIFNSLCQRVLELKEVTKPITPWQFIDEIQRPFSPNPITQVIARLTGERWGGLPLVMLGSILISFSVLAAMVQARADVVARATVPAPTPTFVIVPTTTATHQPDLSATASVTNTTTTSPSSTVTIPVNEFLDAFNIQPSSVALWGVLLVVLGLFLTNNYKSYIREQKLFIERKKAYEARRAMAQNPLERIIHQEDSEPLLREAANWLQEIRFQQSFSSGWSGSLKLPIGLEGSIESAVSLSQRQMSVPEIMAGYLGFVRLASQEYEILIGIDELDKIESGELAQRFLNEIKAIFGVERCFYLISVSENAMSSFERRGLPFRDIFDSSFDTMVYIDYLNLETAKRLLWRRVVGVPVPFLCFCYCLSGGLPRDLIRTCRDLLELAQTQSKRDLSTLVQLLIRSDLKAKFRAVTITAKAALQEPVLNEFLERLHQLELAVDSSLFLLEKSMPLFNAVTASDTQGAPEGVRPASARPEGGQILSVEVAIYLYYMLTLLEFFNQDLNANSLQEAEHSGALTEMARARQAFTISTVVAESRITKFRKAVNMTVPSWPQRMIALYTAPSPQPRQMAGFE